MKKLSLKLEMVPSINGTLPVKLPTHFSGAINTASGRAHATKPQNVGMVSQEIIEFRKDANYPNHSLDDWKKWHLSKHEDGAGIQRAIDETWAKFLEIRNALDNVTKDHIKIWMEDLVYTKTYNGLMVQKAIIKTIADDIGANWRLANADEESKGFDGFINDKPVQIKPESYKEVGKKNNEIVSCPIVYYKKNTSAKKLEFEYNPNDFII